MLTTHDRLPVLEAPRRSTPNGIPAPNSRVEKLRARFRKFYYHGAVDKPTTHDVEHAAEHLAEHNGHPVALGEDFQGVSETGIPRPHYQLSAEPAFHSSHGTFQSVQPFWSSIPRGLLVNSTTSPRFDALVQPGGVGGAHAGAAVTDVRPAV